MAFDINGTYRAWALQYQNKTNSTYLETVSPWYFYAASIIWIGPSFLFAMLATAHFTHFKEYIEFFCCCFEGFEVHEESFGRCSWIVIQFLSLPFCTVINFVFLYLFVPVNLLHNAVRALIAGDDFDAEEENGWFFGSKRLTFFKVQEIVGEALPQLVLNIIFIANNYTYLNANDIFFGIPVPVSIISSVFSLGSLLIGMKSGCPIVVKLFRKGYIY